MITHPYLTDDRVTVWHGDVLDVLPTLPDASIDAVVTDPPYGIAFMGKAWDQPGEFGSRSRRGGGPNKVRGDADAALEAGRYDLSPHAMGNFQRWCEAWARECFRLLKPGGHLLAFGGARTWHRLAVGIEDAGFEVRDSIAWLYGSGFPKSLDVARAIDKATGSEGSWRREDHSGRAGARRSGGAILNQAGNHARPNNPDALRHVYEAGNEGQAWQGWGTALKPAFEPIVVARKPLAGTVAANVLTHGTGALNVDGCRVAHASDADRAESEAKNRHATFGTEAGQNNVYGDYSTTAVKDYDGSAGRWPTNVVIDDETAAELDRQSGASISRVGKPRVGASGDGCGMTATGTEYADAGGASRFFPTFRYEAKAPTSERPKVNGVQHPTVKPLALMRWLVRLVTPPGGTVLDLFGGSGTTAEACLIEGFPCVLIERESEHLPLITQRLSKPLEPVLDLGALA